MSDRRPYWRAYYAANKGRWRSNLRKRTYTQEQRDRYNAHMRAYRRINAQAIKVSRAIGVPLAEARLLVASCRLATAVNQEERATCE